MRDGFELGDLSSWSAIVGGPVPTAPAAFRITELSLLDPHVFYELGGLVCIDGTGVVNTEIATLIDEDEDMDGLLDLSAMLLFRPLEQVLLGQTVDLRGGECSTDPTACALDTFAAGRRLTFDNVGAGECLGPLVGTTSGETPVSEVAAPCFVTEGTDVSLDLGTGDPVPLRDVQIGGTWNAEPADAVETGLLRGFLPETVADSLDGPDGLPFSAFLRGGTGTCATGDDRDVHDTESGWWFYLSFEAAEVPWLGL